MHSETVLIRTDLVLLPGCFIKY